MRGGKEEREQKLLTELIYCNDLNLWCVVNGGDGAVLAG